jgi:hypothetical protein
VDNDGKAIAMGWKEDQAAREEAHNEALERIETAIRELRPKIAREERGPGVSDLGRFPALRIALRLCRDVQKGEGLVQLFRRVPEAHVDRAESRVRCLCGAETVFGDLHPCPGDCGRWFAADGSGAFAARFPVDDAQAA